MSWQRARDPDQKALRRRAILDAAAELFVEKGFEPAALSDIARRAGMAKANLYRYFESKESIFFELYREDLAEWIEEAERRLEPLAGSGDVEVAAGTLADSLAERARLINLIAMSAAALERNVSLSSLVAFKLELVAFLKRLVGVLGAALPGREEEELIQVLLIVNGLVAGLWSVTNPSPTMEAAFADPRLHLLKLDFQGVLRRTLVSLLMGCGGAGIRRGGSPST